MKTTLAVIALALLIGGTVYFSQRPEDVVPNQISTSTPSGTLTGTVVDATSTRVEARIGATVSGIGVSITPTALLEDSRCPVDVQCIQAGTVRIRATLVSGMGTATQEFKLGTPITSEAEVITLVEVTPIKRSTVQVADTEYRFVFTIVKRQ